MWKHTLSILVACAALASAQMPSHAEPVKSKASDKTNEASEQAKSQGRSIVVEPDYGPSHHFETDEPDRPYKGPFEKGEIRDYQVNRKLSDSTRDHEFKVQRGYIRSVKVYWHDRIGDHNEAGGRVYVNSPRNENMLRPEKPDAKQHGQGAADISKKGNWSEFNAETPIYCDGRLYLQIVDDDAWVYRFRVEYANRPSRPEPPVAHEPDGVKPYSRRYSVDRTIRPYQDPTLSLGIDRGYVESVEVRWNDDPGDHRAYGRVYLNRTRADDALEPVGDETDRFGWPAADIHKDTHWTKFRVNHGDAQYCDGRLIIEILNDKAKIYEVRVNYAARRRGPQASYHDDDNWDRPREGRIDVHIEHREQETPSVPNSKQSLFSDRFRDSESGDDDRDE
ncbi:hypothetical protein JXA32_02465 [Candidatus Sumerlaeota bacterium]|nr:hypothetical protein [Candidatus Sumerlaeota bacterium]